MEQQNIQGNWNEIKGKVKETWGKLTDDELDSIGGSYDKLVGKVQKKYGYAFDETKEKVNEFLKKVNRKMTPEH